MHNKQRRTYERQEDQTGIPSWWREAGRSKSERCEVSTGAHPGDAAGTPSLPNHGPEIHRNRIPRHSKPGFQRSSSRLCLELNMLAPSRGLASSIKPQAASSKLQATSRKLQALKIIINQIQVRAQSFKPQAASDKLQAARAFIKFFSLVSFRRN